MTAAVELDLTQPADFGRCLKRAVRLLMMDASNMKPAELARRTRLHYNTLNQHLKIDGPDLTGPEIKAIADALETTPQRIYDIANELSEGEHLRAEWEPEVFENPEPMLPTLEYADYRHIPRRGHLATV